MVNFLVEIGCMMCFLDFLGHKRSVELGNEQFVRLDDGVTITN